MISTYIELFVEYLQSERNASQNTVESYFSDLHFFNKYIQMDIVEIKQNHIEGYVKHLCERNLKATSIKRKLSALKQFFLFLVSEKLISADPMNLIERPQKSFQLPKIISEEIVQKLYASTDLFDKKEAIRVRLIIDLLYGSGMRVSELISLKKNAFVKIDEKFRFVRILGKGKKERIVPIANGTNDVLCQWLDICDDSDWLFASINNTKHITRQRIFQILKTLSVYSGVDASKISPHVLRHAFATHILDNGADLLSIKKMLGHKDIATTEIYTHVSRKKINVTVEKFHPLSANFKKSNYTNTQK